VSYSIKISKTARAETRQIFEYLTVYSSEVADKHLVRLTNSISLIGRDPFLCPFFFLTGAPYRAKLFSVGRTSFWVVYEVDATKRTVDILRIWNSKQNPEDFEF
jgi:plasmid stabilization system protein ParE